MRHREMIAPGMGVETEIGDNMAIQNALDSIGPLRQTGKAGYLETVIEFSSQLNLPIMGKRVLKQSS